MLWVTFSSNRDYGLHLKNSGFDNYYPPEGPSYDQPQPASKQNILFDGYAQPADLDGGASSSTPNRTLDATDRSYPAFWLPFQEVTAHNHSAQWVAQVQSGRRRRGWWARRRRGKRRRGHGWDVRRGQRLVRSGGRDVLHRHSVLRR